MKGLGYLARCLVNNRADAGPFLRKRGIQVYRGRLKGAKGGSICLVPETEGPESLTVTKSGWSSVVKKNCEGELRFQISHDEASKTSGTVHTESCGQKQNNKPRRYRHRRKEGKGAGETDRGLIAKDQERDRARSTGCRSLRRGRRIGAPPKKGGRAWGRETKDSRNNEPIRQWRRLWKSRPTLIFY